MEVRIIQKQMPIPSDGFVVNVESLRQDAYQNDGIFNQTNIDNVLADCRRYQAAPNSALLFHSAFIQGIGNYSGSAPHAEMGGYGSGPNYENPQMPNYAWPSYASYPNYAALTYPKQYSPTAWPYIGPFYPYPQVPLGWRKVTLEWDDGWWFLDFSHQEAH